MAINDQISLKMLQSIKEVCLPIVKGASARMWLLLLEKSVQRK